jgi:hypothetical protein
MFKIGNDRVVNLWSNGVFASPAAGPIYGAAVATSAMELDYVGGVSLVPEPATRTMTLFALGLAGLLARRGRRL